MWPDGGERARLARELCWSIFGGQVGHTGVQVGFFTGNVQEKFTFDGHSFVLMGIPECQVPSTSTFVLHRAPFRRI